MDFWQLLGLIGERYPSLIPILKQPGVFAVVSQAIQENWPIERLQAGLQATPYYQSTPLERRQFDILAATDPATARKKAVDTDLLVRRIAGELGIPPQSLDALFVLDAVGSGWDEGRIRMELVARTSGATQLGPGGIGDTMNQYQKLAGEYGVPVHHNDLYWWAANTQGGTVSEAGFRDFVTQQAKNLFPALAPALDQGQTVMQFATPYFSMAAQELGINPNQINLLNPKWAEVFMKTNDKGEQGVRSLQEAQKVIRTDASFGYDEGTPAVTQAAQFATALGQRMGALG